MAPVVYFVIPCYCEEDMLPVSAPVFLSKMESLIESGKADAKSRILFIDDGSSDRTWDLISAFAGENTLVEGIRLACNSGEDNAQRAGMHCALDRADCVISMDCDLQDNINTVVDMLERFSQGNDIVLGIRSSREEDPLKERFFSASYYLMMRILGTGLIKNQANCRLLSIDAARMVLQHEESSYLPALVSSLPLKKEIVYYKRKAREKGTTKYNFLKKLTLAFDSMLLHAKKLRTVLLIASLAMFLLAIVGCMILLKYAAAFVTLRLVLTFVFCFGGVVSAGLCFSFKRLYAQACQRNLTGFQIAETTF